MLLETIFGGGKQSSPSNPPSGGTDEPAAPPSSGSGGQPDPIYDEEPGDTNDGTYGETPQSETDSDDASDAPVESDTQVEESPAPVTDEMPAAPAPSPVASTPSEETAAPEESPAEGETVRDFVTPLLSDLQEIRQRQTGGATDARLESRNRAVAAIQDQLASRLLDELQSDARPEATAAPVQDVPTTQSQPLSLVNRWYAEV